MIYFSVFLMMFMLLAFAFCLYMYAKCGSELKALSEFGVDNSDELDIVLAIYRTDVENVLYDYTYNNVDYYNVSLDGEIYKLVVWEDSSISIHKGGECIHNGHGTHINTYEKHNLLMTLSIASKL